MVLLDLKAHVGLAASVPKIIDKPRLISHLQHRGVQMDVAVSPGELSLGAMFWGSLQAIAYRPRGGGVHLRPSSRGGPPPPTSEKWSSGKNEIYKRVPKLEADITHRNFFLASDPICHEAMAGSLTISNEMCPEDECRGTSVQAWIMHRYGSAPRGLRLDRVYSLLPTRFSLEWLENTHVRRCPVVGSPDQSAIAHPSRAMLELSSAGAGRGSLTSYCSMCVGWTVRSWITVMAAR